MTRRCRPPPCAAATSTNCWPPCCGPRTTPQPYARPYLDAVRARFEQWIRDLCSRPWDEQWPTYQYEIARRHTETTGRTDHFSSDQSHVPLRYLIAVAWPVTATIRGFLAAQGLDQAEADAMYTPWFKAVTLTVAQWAQPYAPERW